MTTPSKPRDPAKILQDDVMRALHQSTRRHKTGMEKWRWPIVSVLGLVCLLMPIMFGLYAWQHAQVSLATRAAAGGVCGPVGIALSSTPS